jgi:hypothetical protein
VHEHQLRAHVPTEQSHQLTKAEQVLASLTREPDDLTYSLVSVCVRVDRMIRHFSMNRIRPAKRI